MDPQAEPHPVIVATLASDAWRPRRKKLKRFIARRVPESDVDDILQETELRMVTGRAAYDGKMDVYVFACRVARHVASDARRSKMRKDKHEMLEHGGADDGGDDWDHENPPMSEPSPASTVEHLQAWEAIKEDGRAAFAEGTLERAVLEGTLLGKTVEEIAKEEGVANKTTHDARGRLLYELRKRRVLAEMSGGAAVEEPRRSRRSTIVTLLMIAAVIVALLIGNAMMFTKCH